MGNLLALPPLEAEQIEDIKPKKSKFLLDKYENNKISNRENFENEIKEEE